MIRMSYRIVLTLIAAITLPILAAGCDESSTSTAVPSVAASSIGEKATNADHVELDGSISGLSGVCPSITFAIGGRTVTTNAGTLFDNAPCNALANGNAVEVDGTTQPNGSILATEVELVGGRWD